MLPAAELEQAVDRGRARVAAADVDQADVDPHASEKSLAAAGKQVLVRVATADVDPHASRCCRQTARACGHGRLRRQHDARCLRPGGSGFETLFFAAAQRAAAGKGCHV